MKKIYFLFFILLFSATTVNAQKYSINKKNYDYHLYIPQRGDPMNPAVSGICSFIMPGLGQMINGEVPRGLAFLGGSFGCFLVMGTGEILLIGSVIGGMDGNDTGINPSLGAGLMIAGAAGLIAVDIWSIVDAVNVTKVNNMYYQDQKKKAIGLELKPYIGFIQMNNLRMSSLEGMTSGLTLKVSF